MTHFDYRGGVLHAEDVALPDVEALTGTPVYVYSANAIKGQFRRLANGLKDLDHLICYSVKANSNQAILKLLADIGSGFDAVSGGEIARILAVGVPGDRIVFSGVGKTRSELESALAAGVRQFNVESEPELELLNEVALSMNRVAPVALRVNPDVDAGTHRKIATGTAEAKFGIPVSRARGLYLSSGRLPGIRFAGVDVHIGSQLTSLGPFESAYRVVADMVADLRSCGIGIERIDLGGGLGVAYDSAGPEPPSIEDWCNLIRQTVGHLGCEIDMEPGRLIVAEAGILLSTVILVKQGQDRSFLVVDAAMNDLIRPAMYDSSHVIQPVRRSSESSKRFDVVGPVCETGDRFAQQVLLQPARAGDLLAFMTAGAYGSVMASEYNSRPLVAEAIVDGNRAAIVRERPGIQDLISRDRIPHWL